MTGIKISSLEDAQSVCRLLHQKGVKTIIITSLFLEDNVILLLASHNDDSGQIRQFLARQPKIQGYFSGTGDLFSALCLGHILSLSPVVSESVADPQTGTIRVERHRRVLADHVKQACALSIGTVLAVLLRTKKYQQDHLDELSNTGFPSGELRLIQSLEDIVSPQPFAMEEIFSSDSKGKE